MRAASLRHSMTIEAPTTTRDALGEPVASWSTFATTMADIADVSGDENYAKGIRARTIIRVTTRFISGVTPDMRLCAWGNVYDILSALDLDGRMRTLTIVARVTN